MSDYWSGNITEAVQDAQEAYKEQLKEQLEKETAKADSDAERRRAVSYTHLTLPTMRTV